MRVEVAVSRFDMVFNTNWKTDAALLSLFTSNILTHWTTFYQPFSYLHWCFPCHKYLAVTYINTRKRDGNSLYAPKHSSWTKLLRKISSYWCNFTVLFTFFNVKKERLKTDRKKCYKCSANIEFFFFLDLKVCFSLITWKIMIKLHSFRPIKSLKFLHW